MNYKRAGRILAAIVLAGLAAVPFTGQISLVVAAIVVGLVQFVWLTIDGVREIRNPLRRHAWSVVAMIAVEYSVFILIVCAALVFFIRVLPEFSGSN